MLKSLLQFCTTILVLQIGNMFLTLCKYRYWVRGAGNDEVQIIGNKYELIVSSKHNTSKRQMGKLLDSWLHEYHKSIHKFLDKSQARKYFPAAVVIRLRSNGAKILQVSSSSGKNIWKICHLFT